MLDDEDANETKRRSTELVTPCSLLGAGGPDADVYAVITPEELLREQASDSFCNDIRYRIKQ